MQATNDTRPFHQVLDQDIAALWASGLDTWAIAQRLTVRHRRQITEATVWNFRATQTDSHIISVILEETLGRVQQ